MGVDWELLSSNLENDIDEFDHIIAEMWCVNRLLVHLLIAPELMSTSGGALPACRASFSSLSARLSAAVDVILWSIKYGVLVLMEGSKKWKK